VTRF